MDDFDELDENTTTETPLIPDSNTDFVEPRQYRANLVHFVKKLQLAILAVKPMSLNICVLQKRISSANDRFL